MMLTKVGSRFWSLNFSIRIRIIYIQFAWLQQGPYNPLLGHIVRHTVRPYFKKNRLTVISFSFRQVWRMVWAWKKWNGSVLSVKKNTVNSEQQWSYCIKSWSNSVKIVKCWNLSDSFSYWSSAAVYTCKILWSWRRKTTKKTWLLGGKMVTGKKSKQKKWKKHKWSKKSSFFCTKYTYPCFGHECRNLSYELNQ